VYDDTNTTHLDPVTSDRIKQLRDRSARLSNGDAQNLELIGRAVADLGFLLAALIESKPVTARDCEMARRQVGCRFGWPAAVTVITTVLIAAGIALTAVLKT